MTWCTSRLEALEMALLEARTNKVGFTVCHGQPFCNKNVGVEEFESCEWCLRIHAGDTRTAEELEAILISQERGH